MAGLVESVAVSQLVEDALQVNMAALQRHAVQVRREFERRFLTARLQEHGGNISRTAEAIGMARESLSRKLTALKIRTPRSE